MWEDAVCNMTETCTSTDATSKRYVCQEKYVNDGAQKGQSKTELIFINTWMCLNKWLLLLDYQSTCNVFMNKDLFVPGSIKYVKKGVRICCNSGKKIIHYKGQVDLGEEWFDTDGIANMYFFANIRKWFPTRYDTDHNIFEVDAPEGKCFSRWAPTGCIA